MDEVNYFQTVAIIHPGHNKESVDKLVELCQTLTSKHEQLKIYVDYAGTKTLAYEIRGLKTGYFIEIIWMGTKKDVSEVERYCHIDDNVLKFLTVKVIDSHPTLEPLIDTSKEYADAYEIIFR